MANLQLIGLKELNGDIISGPSRPLWPISTFCHYQLQEDRSVRRNGALTENVVKTRIGNHGRSIDL
jgi:hypothetical protein